MSQPVGGHGSGLASVTVMKTARLTLAALLVGVLSACVTDESTENEGRPPPGDRFVIVLLTDDEMTVASEVAAGTVSFEVENNGASEHGFAIEGPDVSERIERIGPSERDVLTVNLEPGSYTVFSPTGEDRANGFEATLEVTEAPPSEFPEDQGGVGPSEEQDEIDDEGP
jgi:hypothetical protein